MDDESELQKTVRRITLGQNATTRALERIGGSSALARHAALLESPAFKMMRDFQNSPMFRMQQEIANSPAFRLQRELENSAFFQMQKELTRLNELSAITSLDATVFEHLETFKAQQNMFAEQAEMLRRFRLPKSLIDAAALHVADIVDPPNVAGMTDPVWASRIGTVLSGLSIPWMSVEHSALSLQGVGVLTRLSDTARFAPTFDHNTRELFDETLGGAVEIDPDGDEDDADVVHLDAGMDPGLVILSPPETGEILRLSGFELVVPYAPAPVPLSSDGEPLHYDPSYADFITQIERKMRSLIDAEMTRAFGESWIKARISGDLKRTWKERREKARIDGEPVFALLNYADFIDLKTIVISNASWNAVFKDRFGVKEHFMTQMDRLYAVRKPLAHGRPISNGQMIHLYIEGVALMRTLGVDIIKA